MTNSIVLDPSGTMRGQEARAAAPMPSTTRRPHDARASRRALLDAAAQLFQERGYRGATIREIGERAGVDPALIARYFDGKEGLYLAALADERHAPSSAAVESADLVDVARLLLAHWDEHGHSPAVHALLSATPTDEVREQVRAIVGPGLLEPVAAHLERQGVSQPRRRAQVLLGALAGVDLLRRNGVLPDIAQASSDELLELLVPMVAALQGDG
jgi:AcrR family transcriptional regulator